VRGKSKRREIAEEFGAPRKDLYSRVSNPGESLRDDLTSSLILGSNPCPLAGIEFESAPRGCPSIRILPGSVIWLIFKVARVR
jgi:hypothetical protein